MKTTLNIFFLMVFVLISNSCMDEYTEEFTANSPVYMTYKDLRQAVKKSSARDLVKPGKIYFKDGYIYINETMKGVHIINNTNPKDPKNVGFIEIPGNVDIAIKDNILYADSYIDMVAIDISDLNNIRLVNRIEKIFAYTTPPYDQEYPLAVVDEEKGVVIEWEVKRVRQKMEYRYYPVYLYAKAEMDFALSNSTGASGGAQGGSTFGVGGSMARFGLYKDYLYTVDTSTLYMFDVKVPSSPSSLGKQNVGWNVETMFIYGNHMFFGTTTGMQIFNLDVPTVPKYVTSFWHATSCDPVVISDGYAYVTLRGGRTCNNNNINRLDVVKLSSDYKNNTLIASYGMTGPYGLGIDGQTLFVCDGDAGLKVYDVTDKLRVDSNMIARFANINTYDVIPLNNYLFMIGKDGFYQYDYSNLKNIYQVSFIPVKKA